MAKAATRKITAKKKKPRKTTRTIHKIVSTIYQLQVKGPERNLALTYMVDHIVKLIQEGNLLNNQDYYGETVRCYGDIKLHEDPPCLQLGVVKYNAYATGLTWHILEQTLNTNDPRVTAQLTELYIYPLDHVAVLVSKTHGPNPSQITSFLNRILLSSARDLSLKVDIDVLPLKVGGTTAAIKGWTVLKALCIEVIRPNPSGRVKSKKIKSMLNKSQSDKVKIQFSSQTDIGLDQKGVKEYVEEADSLITSGQGSVTASGIDEDGLPVKVDSKNVQVQKFSLKKYGDDVTSMAKFLYESLKIKFKRQ